MILNATLSKLIKLATVATKYSTGDLTLYKCSDGRWRGCLTQKTVGDTALKFNTFIIDHDETLWTGDETVIHLPMTLIDYLANTKKRDMEVPVVESLLQAYVGGNVPEDINTFTTLSFETVALDKGAYLEYHNEEFDLNVDPTVFVNITTRTTTMDIAFVRHYLERTEIAISVEETETMKTVGTVMVLC